MPVNTHRQAGQYHYMYVCPCMEGGMKKFQTAEHRKMYLRLHKKKCNIPSEWEPATQFIKEETGEVLNPKKLAGH